MHFPFLSRIKYVNRAKYRLLARLNPYKIREGYYDYSCCRMEHIWCGQNGKTHCLYRTQARRSIYVYQCIMKRQIINAVCQILGYQRRDALSDPLCLSKTKSGNTLQHTILHTATQPRRGTGRKGVKQPTITKLGKFGKAAHTDVLCKEWDDRARFSGKTPSIQNCPGPFNNAQIVTLLHLTRACSNRVIFARLNPYKIRGGYYYYSCCGDRFNTSGVDRMGKHTVYIFCRTQARRSIYVYQYIMKRQIINAVCQILRYHRRDALSDPFCLSKTKSGNTLQHTILHTATQPRRGTGRKGLAGGVLGRLLAGDGDRSFLPYR
eukprot:sb/3466832/